jgi:hypothetical protein
MEYRDFLPERRRRMADIIRVAFRQLGGESDATLLTPPWFTPGAEEVWTSIGRGVPLEWEALRRLHLCSYLPANMASREKKRAGDSLDIQISPCCARNGDDPLMREGSVPAPFTFCGGDENPEVY